MSESKTKAAKESQSFDFELQSKKAKLSQRIHELDLAGKVTRLTVSESGAIVIPKDDSLNEDWIREVWTV
jgi:hypothetical protein